MKEPAHAEKQNQFSGIILTYTWVMNSTGNAPAWALSNADSS